MEGCADSIVFVEQHHTGAWELSEGTSSFLQSALDVEEEGMGTVRWGLLCSSQRLYVAMERSRMDVIEANGWGVVGRIEGKLVAKGEVDLM